MARLSPYSPQELCDLLAHANYLPRALAKNLKTSLRTLTRRSLELFGASAHSWANAERVKAAPALLKKWRCVKLAAFALGFKHPQQLSTFFKRHYRACPTEFLADLDRHDLLEAQPHTAKMKRGAKAVSET